MNQAREVADKVYVRHLKLARLAFQENVEVWKALGLDGSRADGFAEWLAQARRFYTNILNDPAILAALLPYHTPSVDLTNALALLDTAEAAYAAREKASGLAIQATRTRNRDEALRALKEFVRVLVAIARITLEDRPDLLLALGIPVRA